MPPDRAERVAEIVEAALERETADFAPFLDQACADDSALRREVESLLRFRSDAAGFIEQPAFQASAQALADEMGLLAAGETVGDYRIVSLLGEGGMGEVYLADDLSLGRKVALKFVKSGLGGRDVVRHFRREERILAGLNHPNIARLYGAAVTERGAPYFVMEYVEGLRLDECCDRHRLSVPERLQLFRKICGAVAYAHQHLVIHRDLKPPNIRVTPEGEPKLLDFGIAKLLDPDQTARGEATMTLASAMTPEYASPEQVRGDEVTTATDVYSLGVVLYELLTGRKPYRLTSHAPAEVSRVIGAEIPARPSDAIAQQASQMPPPLVPPETPNPRLLRGDIDNIVLMAMRKEPERRYASVALLSEDIRRHLDGLPVAARKDTVRYRTTKFIRRHTLGVAGAGLLLLTLIGGIVATTWQARVAMAERARAEQRFNDVRKLANSFLFEIHDEIENLPGSTRARELLVRRALEYLDSLAREAGGDPSLQREVVLAYIKVGNVQGNPQNANLGDSDGAMQSYRKALEIAQRWSAVEGEVALRRPLALVYEKMADVEASTNQFPQAVEDAQKALAIFKELAQARPDDADAQRSLALSHLKLGDVLGNPNLTNAGDPGSAMEQYRAALGLLEALRATDPQHPRTRRFIGMIHERIGSVLEAQNDTTGALREYQASAAIRVPLGDEFPHDTTIVRDAAIAYEKLANSMIAQGDLANALENRRKALAIFTGLFQLDPKNTHAQQSLAVSHLHLADLLGAPAEPNLNRPDEALANYRAAQKLIEPIANAPGGDTQARVMFKEITERISALGATPATAAQR